MSHHMFTPPPPTHTHVQPLPPSHTIYIYIVIREESFVESEQKTSNTADCEWNLSLARTLMIVLKKTVWAPHQYCLLFFHVAGTQTVLTFPISCDLEKLLAGATSCFSEDDNNRDLSSSSLRRKLFGKPDRQVWRTYPHWQGQSISSLFPRPGHSSFIPKPLWPHSQTIPASVPNHSGLIPSLSSTCTSLCVSLKWDFLFTSQSIWQFFGWSHLQAMVALWILMAQVVCIVH